MGASMGASTDAAGPASRSPESSVWVASGPPPLPSPGESPAAAASEGTTDGASYAGTLESVCRYAASGSSDRPLKGPTSSHEATKSVAVAANPPCMRTAITQLTLPRGTEHVRSSERSHSHTAFTHRFDAHSRAPVHGAPLGSSGRHVDVARSQGGWLAHGNGALVRRAMPLQAHVACSAPDGSLGVGA